jgi:hypothetical protein
MNTAKKISGVALAAAAATMFAIAPMNASAGAHSAGKCIGGNSCKGSSACATATTGCAGQNSCEGKGWIKTTKAECEEKGGEFEG